MKMIDEAKSWHKLWSIRFAILSAALGAAELTLPLWSGVIPPHIFATLSTVTAVAAAVARVIKQESIE